MLALGITCSMALACDINKIVNPKAIVGADSLKVSISRDTALAIHGTTTLKLTPTVGTIGQLAVRWSSSATSVAAVDSVSGVLTGNAIGNAVITAKVYAPELGATVTDTLSVRIRYAGISIKPVDSLTSIGQKSLLDVRGTDIAGIPVATIPASSGTKSGVLFTTRDASVVDVDTVGNVIAVKNGASARVVVTYQGMKDSTTVKVRQVAKSIAFPSAVAGEVAIQSLNLARSIATVVKDALGGVIPTPTITWTTSDTTVVKIGAATGSATALKVGTATLTATSDGFAQTVVARITQLPFKIDKTAGDAQSAVVGTAVAVLPKVTVLDSGLAPIPSVAVTFAVGTGGGTITGGAQTSSTSGQANVGSWTLGSTAGANTLVATSGGASATFTATGTPSTPTKLVFVAAPTSTGVGAVIAPAVKVAVTDAAGNIATTATNSITLTLASGSGTLGGTVTAAAVAGVATFSNLTVSAAGTFTLGASATGLTSGTSDPFAVFGAAAKLAFSVQPSNVSATAPIAPAIKVTVQDAGGATVLNSTVNVTLAFVANPGSATLGGTLTVPAVAGVATFSNISVSAVGTGYTLKASSTGLTDITSTTFNITPIGAATTLAFQTQPPGVTAGVTMTSFTVGVTDANGAVITSENSRVITVSLPGVAFAAGTASRTVVNGVATFNDIVINKAGAAYRLSATAAPTLSGVPTAGVSSAAFAVTSAAVAKLGFVTSPSGAEAGGVISPAVQVGQVDAFGNVVTAAAAVPITVALTAGTGTAGATLSGTATATAASGVASFTNLAVSAVGSGYTLTATSGTLTSATSAPFNVVSTGQPVRLAFTAQPLGGQVGTPMAAVKVAIQLADGSIATSVAPTPVTLTFLANPGGAVLSGGQATTVNGVATFSALSIDKLSSYQLVATAAPYSSATSNTFSVTGETQLLFNVQPTDVESGKLIAPSVKVAIADASGAIVTTATQAVTLGILTGTGKTGASVVGTKTVNAVAGIATFTDVRIDSAGAGYKLQATAAGTTLTSVSSAAFAVNAGAAKQLVFQVQPQATLANQTFASAVKVIVADSVGNVVTTATNAITMSITPGTGANGSTLTGTVTVSAVGGVATFSGIAVNGVGANYTLTAAATGLPSAISSQFTTSVGAANKILFQVPPTGSLAGGIVAPPVKVMITDAAGNLVSSASGSISLVLNSTVGAVLGGTLTQATTGGVATFSNLTIDRAGTYTLSANTTGLTGNSVTSAAFNVTGVASQLVFTAQPTTAVQNGGFSVSVALADAAGTTVTSATNPVTIALSSGGTAGAVLAGTTTVSAVAGVATFSNLKIDKAGSAYVLAASATGLGTKTSNAFNVVVGSATKLVFITNPSNSTGGAPFASTVQVAVVDSVGNVVTTAGGTISLSIAAGTGTSGATVVGTATATPSSGVASFPNLAVDKAGTGYQLAATTGVGQSGTSTTFNVTVGPSSRLTYLVSPSAATSGAALSPTVQVAVTDLGGNTVPSATDVVTLSVTGPGSLSGTKTVSAVSGVASFPGLSLDVAGSYTMLATATGLGAATSASFPISVGAPTGLAFVTAPSSITAGQNSTWSVAIVDNSGNRVTTATSPVTIAVTTGTGVSGAVFTGTKTVNAVGGLATFSDLQIDKGGSGYTFTATSTGLTSGASGVFTVTTGAAAGLAFVTNPANSTGGAPFSPTVQVAVVDAGGNVVTAASTFITIGIGPGGTTGAAVTGTTSASASGGVASFPNLAVDKAGAGYRLQASGGGLASGLSVSFDVTVGPKAKLAYVVQPSGSTGGVPWAPTVQVAVTDLGGNTVTSATDAITVATTSSTPLNGTKTVSAVAGVASFPSVSIDLNGSYTLLATATGLASASSVSFPIAVGPAAALSFFSSPTVMTAAQNATWNAQVVDLGGNRVTSATNPITISILPGTGTSGAALSGTSLTLSASGGAVSFPVQIDKSGTAYQLRITSTGLTTGTSAAFTVNTGSVAQIVFGVIPKATFVNAPLNPDTAVTIRTLDAAGNPVSSTDNFSITLVTGPGGASISGISFNAVAGVATVPASVFPNVPGSTWQVRANDNSRGINVTSPVFSVAAFDAPSKIGIVTQPTAMQYLVVPSTAPVVAVQDKYGNTVTTSTDSIAVTLTTNPGAATLGGAGARAVAGVAALANLTLDQAGTGYVITAQDVTTATLPSVAMNAFNVSTPGTVVASTSVASMALTGKRIYWTDAAGTGGQIRNVSATGGTITSLTATLSSAGQIVTDGTTLYWSEIGAGGAGQGKISSMPVAGGAITTVASGLTSLANKSLILDGGSLYFTAIQNSGSNFAVRKVATTGGTVTDLVVVNTTVPAFTVAGGLVYYGDPTVGGGAVKSIAVTGGASTTISSGALPITGYSGTMRVVGSTLYMAVGANLLSVPISGGTNTTRVTGSSGKADLVSDGTNMYYTDAGSGTRKLNLTTFVETAAYTNGSLATGLILDGPSLYLFNGSILKGMK